MTQFEADLGIDNSQSSIIVYRIPASLYGYDKPSVFKFQTGILLLGATHALSGKPPQHPNLFDLWDACNAKRGGKLLCFAVGGNSALVRSSGIISTHGWISY